ncbi:uncharacterized protein LOC144749507 [Ciona intestinalis]
MALSAVDQLGTLLKIFPTTPKGCLLKVYQELKHQNLQAAEEIDNDSDDTEPILDTSESGSLSSLDELLTRAKSSGSSNAFEDISNLTRAVPKIFPVELCNFGFHAKQLIQSGKITEKGKREVTSELIRVMRNYERHPTRSTRGSAVNSFVRLGKATLGFTEEEAKKFWLHKITQKINNQVKQQRRVQFSPTTSKRRQNNTAGTAVTSIVKRRRISPEQELDVDLMHQNKQLLQEEFKKPCGMRNKRLLSEMMIQTFATRRNFFSTNPDPNKEWPALTVYDEVNKSHVCHLIHVLCRLPFLVREFKRIQNFEKESFDTLHIFPSIIEYAKQHSKSKQVQRILQKLPLSEEPLSLEVTCQNFIVLTDQKILFGSWLLCNIMPSNTAKLYCSERYLVDLCPENTTTDDISNAVADRHQPFIVVLGTIHNFKKIRLFCEKYPLIEVKTLTEALTALFSYYYVYNYVYCPHIHLALQFLQALGLNITTNVSDSVKEMALKLKL